MANDRDAKVTGLVLTKDGERLLEQCLRSLAWCDELLVVDSESTDATRDMAERLGARVLVRKWQGPGPQFQFALSEVSTPWVVSLDQDEFLTPELTESIESALASDTDGLAGFYVNRANYYFDRFPRHGALYPDRLLRVFMPSRMEVRVSGAHYSFHPKGATQRLAGDIRHFPYASLAEHLDKINSYSQQAAEAMYAKGKKGGVAKGLAHGMIRFLKLYVLKLGVLDGRAGLAWAVHGFFYAFLKYVRLAELHVRKDTPSGPGPHSPEA